MADRDSSPGPAGATQSADPRVPIFVATSVMLTFISFWRAAAVVLCDLGSSAFYAGGIAEQAVGKAAPWFILAILCFSYAIRGVYIESCIMFVRGGIYRVVSTALGRNLAKVSVSTLMFDYVLTGPISAVVAGQYLLGLVDEILHLAGSSFIVPRDAGAAAVAVIVTLFFWYRNIQGVHDTSDKALRTVQLTSIMVVLLILWSSVTLLLRGGEIPPSPVPANLHFQPEALGWLQSTGWHKTIGLVGILIAFGHAVLAMSGEESLAQVNREIAHPKVKNLRRAGLVVFLYSLIFTSLVSFLGVMIIPDAVRPGFLDNLIGGLAMNVAGPYYLRLGFHIFVVVVGFFILSGAVNTSMVGANGVLTRISEDGLLPGWFRRPHRRYGTSFRTVNLTCGLQVLAILISRGDTYVLGEAYAFGVLWSFVFNTASMFVLRFKNRETREWRVPLNLPLGNRELPVGILLILVLLLATAGINLLTKEVGTISGLLFTLGFFVMFTASDRQSRKHPVAAGLDQFNLIRQENIDVESVKVRPAPVIVSVRDYRSLHQLEAALNETDTAQTDVVVMTARIISGAAAGYREIFEEHLFTDYEQRLFTIVVRHAERMGKPVKLLVVPSNNPVSAVVNVANQLGASRVYAGASEKLAVQAQARQIGKEWEAMGDLDKIQFDYVVVPEDGHAHRFQIGAHTPQINPEDVDRIHQIWLEITENVPDTEFHHSDVVSLALQRFEQDLAGDARSEILTALEKKHARKERPRRHRGY